MRRLIWVLLPLICVATMHAEQLPASAVWPLTSIVGGTPVISGAITVESQKLSVVTVKDYTGGAVGDNAQNIGNTTFDADEDPTKYIEFALTPKPGATFEMDSICFLIGGKGGSNMRANIYYSTDPTFADRMQLSFKKGQDILRDALEYYSQEVSITIADQSTLYLRFYPYYKSAGATGKYLSLKNVGIYGKVSGSNLVDLPIIATDMVSRVSTTHFTAGGTISNDGGAPVIERGVVYNTVGAPTLNDTKILAGEGSGTFSAEVASLTAGTTYYYRAYATNQAGTSYGGERTVTTLTQLQSPTVTTSSASSVLAVTAKVGGNVASWGGCEVTERGICWSTHPNPTIEDSKVALGMGLGSFTTQLYNLQPATTYYYTAYAINCQGAGYGAINSFNTQAQAPDVTKIVSADGMGDYLTVQAALDAVPAHYTGRWIIHIKPGVYYEKLLLPANKPHVILYGEDAMTTILTYDDYAGKDNLGTSGSYSVAIEADDFMAVNITFQNTIKNDGTHGQSEQAVALRVKGDRNSFYNCRMLGYQDTYYGWGSGRVYHKNCYIEGSVDFIFGASILLFESCTLHVNRNDGVIAAASTAIGNLYGYVFKDCKITTVPKSEPDFRGTPMSKFYLGRPWQAEPRTVFISCEEPETLHPDGWTTMSVAPYFFREYRCTGPGAESISLRKNGGAQLTDEEALLYTNEQILSKRAGKDFAYDWTPPAPYDPNHSAVLTIQEEPPFMIYPTPVVAESKVVVIPMETGNMQLNLINIQGQMIHSLFTGAVTQGQSIITTLDRGDLPQGIYTLQWVNNSLVYSQKIGIGL